MIASYLHGQRCPWALSVRILILGRWPTSMAVERKLGVTRVGGTDLQHMLYSTIQPPMFFRRCGCVLVWSRNIGSYGMPMVLGVAGWRICHEYCTLVSVFNWVLFIWSFSSIEQSHQRRWWKGWTEPGGVKTQPLCSRDCTTGLRHKTFCNMVLCNWISLLFIHEIRHVLHHVKVGSKLSTLPLILALALDRIFFFF